MLDFRAIPIHARRPLGSLLLAPLVALALVVSASASADGYLSVLEDVPLMPGLREVTNAGLEFEAATGRIVEAMAVGPHRPGLNRGTVLDFYNEALPQLGWRPVTQVNFVRESEVLDLSIEETPERVTVRFGLKPR